MGKRNRESRLRPHQRVILRDVAIFLVKLWIDGLKDIVFTGICLSAAAIDFIRGPRPEGLLFYRAMRWSERFDLWLNLYGAAEQAEHDSEGLFGASRAGDATFLGRLEEMTGGERGQKPPEQTDHPSS